MKQQQKWKITFILFGAILILGIVLALAHYLFLSTEEKHIRGFEKSNETNSIVKLTIDEQAIYIELYEDAVPLNANHFKTLVEDNWYKKQKAHTFFDVKQDALALFGDPKNNGTGGTGFLVPWEKNKLYNYQPKGSIGLSRLSQDIRGATSQIHITLGDDAPKDMARKHVLIGQVVAGIEILESLEKGIDIDTFEIIE